jgi:hypothetical protein
VSAEPLPFPDTAPVADDTVPDDPPRPGEDTASGDPARVLDALPTPWPAPSSPSYA